MLEPFDQLVKFISEADYISDGRSLLYHTIFDKEDSWGERIEFVSDFSSSFDVHRGQDIIIGHKQVTLGDGGIRLVFLNTKTLKDK